VPNPAPNFVYVIYIAASVYKVWEGLINRGLTQVYWAHYNVSDWKAGSRWQHVRSDKTGKVDIVGRVVEVDPPRRLVITWAFPGDAEDQKQHSRVTFELQALGPDTRLTVTAIPTCSAALLRVGPRCCPISKPCSKREERSLTKYGARVDNLECCLTETAI
jgi:uncharacterized protein YndB with AHSA1/START domain